MRDVLSPPQDNSVMCCSTGRHFAFDKASGEVFAKSVNLGIFRISIDLFLSQLAIYPFRFGYGICWKFVFWRVTHSYHVQDQRLGSGSC